MTDVKSTREYLGMSQELFASYLGIKRSTLSLVETNRRTLSSAAMIKMGLVLIELNKGNIHPSAKAIAALQKQAQIDRSFISSHSKKCNMQAQLLSYELAAMQKQYQQCMKALELSAHVLANLTDTSASNMDKETMQLLELESLRKLDTCGLGAQAILTLKIKTLLYEATEADKLIL